MKRLFFLETIVIGALLCAGGCGDKPDDTASVGAPSSTTGSKQPDTKPAEGKVINAPPTGAIGNEGFRIAPSNPNDPKFKADPKLAGGG